MVHLDRRIADGGREGRFVLRRIRVGSTRENEAARNGRHRRAFVAGSRAAVLRLPLSAMKFSAFQENTAWTSEAVRLVKRYSQRRDRQTGGVGVARLERAPAADLHVQRNVRVVQRDRGEGEPRRESGPHGIAAARTTCPRRRCRCPAARTASNPAPGLPARARSVCEPCSEMAANVTRLVEHVRLCCAGRSATGRRCLPGRSCPRPCRPCGKATRFSRSPEYSP